MNLSELRRSIKNLSDYSPELIDYDNQLDDIINDAYNNVWREKRWNFADHTLFENIYPDLNQATADLTGLITASIVDGQRNVVFSGPIKILISKRDVWEGNILEIDSREYTIVKIISETELAVDEPIRTLDGSATKALISDWVIKARYYRLPEDCIEILSIAHRDVPTGNAGTGRVQPPYGKLEALSPRLDAELGLRQDYTSNYAEAYIPISPIHVPNAEKQTISFNQVAEDSGLGDLIQGTWYEMAWAFLAPDGSVGPLSQSITFQIPIDPQFPTLFYSADFTFRTFDDKIVISKNTTYSAGPGTQRPLEGLRKKLYYNQYFDPTNGVRLGRPLWRELIQGSQTNIAGPVVNANSIDNPFTADDIEGSVTITNKDSFDPGTRQYLEFDGQYLRYRLYPRPSQSDFTYNFTSVTSATPLREQEFFRRLELRYHRKPIPLIASTDTPEMPFEFHNIIVYRALDDLLMKNGDHQAASYYRKKYEDQVKSLEKRYVVFLDINYQKGSFGISGGRIVSDYNSLRKLN